MASFNESESTVFSPMKTIHLQSQQRFYPKREWARKLGGTPPDLLGIVSPFRLSVFHINDFKHHDLKSGSKISAYSTEWDPAKVLPTGPRTC